MNDTETLMARIDRLEMRLSYQDDAIETLNETITAQWKQIDALMRLVGDLGDRVRQAENSSAGDAMEPPPPHY